MKIRGSDPSSHQTNHQSSESTTCRTLVEFQIIVSIWSPKYNSKKCMAQDHLPASNMNGLTPKKKSCSERTDHELPSWTPTFASFTNSDPPSTSHSVSAAAGFNTTMSEWTSTPSTSSTHRGERLGFAGPGLKSLHESKIIKVTFVAGVYGPSFPPVFFFEIEIWPFLTHLHFDVHPRCFKRSTRSPAWECGDCSIHHQSAGSRGFMIFHHQKHTFSNLDDMIGKHLTWGNHTWFGSPNSQLSPALSVWTNAEKRWICSRHHI